MHQPHDADAGEGTIVFKCEASLWDLMATLNPDRRSALKSFDMRRWTLADSRCYRLSWSTQVPERVYDEKQVSFLNKETAEVLTFEYEGLEFPTWAPGWGFILLGKCLAPFPAGIRKSPGDEGG